VCDLANPERAEKENMCVCVRQQVENTYHNEIAFGIGWYILAVANPNHLSFTLLSPLRSFGFTLFFTNPSFLSLNASFLNPLTFPFTLSL